MPWKDPEKRKEMARVYGKRHRAKNKAAQAARMRRWRSRPEIKKQQYAKSREYLSGIRQRALDVYSDGSMVCKHCGYSNTAALCIDHIADNGKQHRQEVGAGSSFWLWLKRNNYPEGFQVLCHNCNFLKELARRRRTTERLP